MPGGGRTLSDEPYRCRTQWLFPFRKPLSLFQPVFSVIETGFKKGCEKKSYDNTPFTGEDPRPHQPRQTTAPSPTLKMHWYHGQLLWLPGSDDLVFPCRHLCLPSPSAVGGTRSPFHSDVTSPLASLRST